MNTQALSVRHPNIMTRPLNMATPQSKYKARSWKILYKDKLYFQTENFYPEEIICIKLKNYPEKLISETKRTLMSKNIRILCSFDFNLKIYKKWDILNIEKK